MKYLIIIFLFIFFLPFFLFSGIWEPNPEKVYQLDTSSYNGYKLSDSNEKWVSSLVNNLKSKGNTVAKHHVFVRTSAIFNIGSDKKGTVYVNRSNKKQFITFDENFFIDFDEAQVDVFGFGGVSIHKGPNDEYLVVIDPYGTKFGGIPVSSGGIPPKFDENVVTWY